MQPDPLGPRPPQRVPGLLPGRGGWGRGHATQAARALLGWGFASLDLHRVQAEADTRNAASARVLEKLGFVLEGTLREDSRTRVPAAPCATMDP